jgi:hypothetical protein
MSEWKALSEASGDRTQSVCAVSAFPIANEKDNGLYATEIRYTHFLKGRKEVNAGVLIAAREILFRPLAIAIRSQRHFSGQKQVQQETKPNIMSTSTADTILYSC